VPLGVELQPQLHPVAAHRVVAARGAVGVLQPAEVPRLAAVVEDDFLVEVP
jgi:hypothetical protein